MGLFSKRDRDTRQQQVTEVAQEPIDCPHTILLPRWDRIEDMGDEDKAIEFVCESCGAHFTAEVAKGLRTAGIS